MKKFTVLLPIEYNDILSEIVDASLYNINKKLTVKLLILGYATRILPLLEPEKAKLVKSMVDKAMRNIKQPRSKASKTKRKRTIPVKRQILVFGGFDMPTKRFNIYSGKLTVPDLKTIDVHK